jgi:ubiquinone biosynthesis protein
VSRVLVLLDTNHNEIDYMRLNNDVRIILDKYKTTDIANIDIKAFFYEMFSMLSRNGINLPKNISMLFRGIVVLEGVLEEINPDINLMSVLKNRVKGTGFNKDVFEGLVLDGIKSGTSLVSIPNEILTFFKGVNTGELRFNIEMNDSKNQVNQILDIFHQGIIAILDVAFIIGISLMVSNDYEFSLSYCLYVVCAGVFTTWLFLKMVANKFKK